jgi:Protein of unknown function (DUF1360)
MSTVVSAEQKQLPLPEYAGLVGLFSGALGSFLVLARGRLPERVGFRDIALLGLASYKIGRLVAKDDVTSFVRVPVTRDEEAQEPEREGLARALGELVTCPSCVGVWTSAGLSVALVLFPRETRFVAAAFGSQAVADFLNAGFVRLREG